jgi:predicted metalloprotease with PDZ domain
MAHLQVALGLDREVVSVAWQLQGVALLPGKTLAQLPLTIAGAPTLQVDKAVAAFDRHGLIPLSPSVTHDEDGEPSRHWTVDRATVGAIQMSYLAEPVTEEPKAATPPLELRREGVGLSGALKCFLLLPPGPEDLSFEVRWSHLAAASEGDGEWIVATSLGEVDSRGGTQLTGTGLERLGDTYVMCGNLADHHHRNGQVSTWWLTDPGVDVEAFTVQLGTTYQVMTQAFDVPAEPYRVFMRSQPHLGASASAHPASFVIAMNPATPLEPASLYETVAHELVHEWLQLDGPTEEVT